MRPIETFAEFEAYLARFTNYERVRTFRYDKKTLGIDRMLAFAEEAGGPERSYPSVHVAGTKGKGSTSLILEALLREEGYAAGTYTSPHVEHLRERIRLDGRPLSDEEVLREINRLLPSLERRREEGPLHFPSFFELMTALAMCAFRTREVDWGIFEVGLGGRFDATNILSPRWTAITSIGFEHTQQLGNTLAKIAREKGGIIKPRTPLVLGPLPEPAAEAITRIALDREAPITQVNEGTVEFAGAGLLRFPGAGEALPAGPVRGPALRLDLAIALEIEKGILTADGRKPDLAAVARALAALSLPARVEVFPGDPPVVIDGAHTAESVEALHLTLEEIAFPRPRTLIFSIASGKELGRILPRLPAIAEEIILTLADPVRSVSPGVLREQMGRGEVEPSPEAAFERALRARRPVVVTGSFYLAGRLRPLLAPAVLGGRPSSYKFPLPFPKA